MQSVAAMATTGPSVATQLASATPAAELLPQLYARYLAQGRSDVEIHLSAAGPDARTRTRALPGGGYSCAVSGLRAPHAHTHAEADAGTLPLAAMLVHEATHCLVAPYMAELGADDDAAAQQLLRLTAESISDARAVIEIFRVDGLAAAQTLVQLMRPQRLAAAGTSHATALALDAAWAAVQQRPQSLHTAAQAFAAALDIGAHAARQTLAGPQRVAAAAAAVALDGPLQAALARAAHAFVDGRHANHALTLRRASDGASTGDEHVFIEADGHLRRVATLGAEGAHSLALLLQMLAASQAPEHQLAVLWLKREGRLEPHGLQRSKLIMGRFLRALGDGQAAPSARMVIAVAEAIDNSRRGEDISAVLDLAAERLRALGDGQAELAPQPLAQLQHDGLRQHNQRRSGPVQDQQSRP